MTMYAVLVCKQGDIKGERTKVFGPFCSERKAEQVERGIELNLSNGWYTVIDTCEGDEKWLPGNED